MNSIQKRSKNHGYEQIVYLLEGSGSLGAYQSGISIGLHEAGFVPNWIIATSIGAIHAAIIAGNDPAQRVDALKKFWQGRTSPSFPLASIFDNPILRNWYNFWNSQWSLFFGQSNFFTPQIVNPWLVPFASQDKISFYDTATLRKTLEELVDFDRINSKLNGIRLNLGAVRIDSGDLVVFDTREQKIGPEHVMASAALPPGFPAVEIEGKMYWSGSGTSNAPLSILLKKKVSEKLLCFMVHLSEPTDLNPTSMDDVLRIHKNTLHSNHYREIVLNHYIIQRLRHAIYTLSNKIPQDSLDQKTRALMRTGRPISLNLVRFNYSGQPTGSCSKNYEFSPLSINEHMEAGYNDLINSFKDPSWLEPKLDDVGMVMHEF